MKVNQQVRGRISRFAHGKIRAKKRPPSTAPTVFSQGPNRSNILEEVIG